MVGDYFHKPAGTYLSPLDADPVPTPERNARVTMMSDKHVVVLIDGEEYTMPTGDFVRIAENTLKHGSTLTRADSLHNTKV
jgi:bifunctional pyridoxal-dependent enzyme with beta-cystathionase and maltose regulon repressor activities